jgi:hypothetical protein
MERIKFTDMTSNISGNNTYLLMRTLQLLLKAGYASPIWPKNADYLWLLHKKGNIIRS